MNLPIDTLIEMIWLFERGQEALRLETYFDSPRGEYVLAITWSDRRVDTECFRDKAAFDARVHALERRLASESWTQAGPPAIVLEGWRRSR